MIASVHGVVKHLGIGSAVIEVGGVGILVHIPASLAATLIVGKTTELFTQLVVREDSLTLYGFETLAAREFFELLQSVSGIGPKVAQSALSIFDEREIASAIANEDNATLEKIPGLGKKGVARLILELKEKVGHLPLSQRAQSAQAWRLSLTSALIGLGYSQKESDAAIDKVSGELGSSAASTPLSELLKFALQNLGRN
jgi:Holliday junction DNA helicase RuvA